MSHPTQITLTDRQYAVLKRESERTGRGLAELVGRGLAARYESGDGLDDDALDESFGAWRDRDFDGAAYVEELRPGLGRRLRPMTTVVDTSVLIDHLRADDRARRLLREGMSSGARVAASVLTKVETLAGVRPHETEATRRLLDRLEWIDVATRSPSRRARLPLVSCTVTRGSRSSTT